MKSPLYRNNNMIKHLIVARRKKISPCVLAATLFSPFAWADLERDPQESHFGVLHVYGTLTESACRLDMASADQSINLGNTSTADLKNVGDHSVLVPVQLYLQDCLRTSSSQNIEKNNVAWSAHQPAVSITFTGIGEPTNPQLARTEGVKGIGLRIKDAQQNNLILGQQGKPVLLAPGDDVILYYIVAERTRGELRAGSFSANINFRLNYE